MENSAVTAMGSLTFSLTTNRFLTEIINYLQLMLSVGIEFTFKPQVLILVMEVKKLDRCSPTFMYYLVKYLV